MLRGSKVVWHSVVDHEPKTFLSRGTFFIF